ncbi:lipid-like atypical dual specificity phosphatase, putative [Trypanosoma equiperdum]|uniref:diphosphoinositol-polyphosphate diphosphatase n=2 Tax=Trypanozoon TaxID=39700 RepID=Q38EH9_TRYB2|nr:hypothetical protein, conserved [Trypanosoma brucei brucei TREU927]EAN76791.1 hypothetical protein, conserved [Trypanosoma brucei brucei TREU927]SCU70481.1 lipid-like atypical dual specificity phosphatase, putative [Trypanosoma equiperdum]
MTLPGQPPPEVREQLVPTINFAMVCPGVYRSGYPTRKNYRFIRALGLRTIIYLCPEDYAESNVKFCEESGITIRRFATEGNKEPFMDISEPLMHRILSALIDTRLHPVLIHCNKGKHRTGTVAACLRLLQGWSLVSIFQEYRSFAGDKVRMGDMQYVELYRPIVRISPPYVADWVCITPVVTVVHTEEELVEAEARQLGWSLLAPPPQLSSPTVPAPAPPPPSKLTITEATEEEPTPDGSAANVSHVGGLPAEEAARPNGKEVAAVHVSAGTPKVRPRASAVLPIPRRGGGHVEPSGSTFKSRDTGGTSKKETEEGRRGAK